MFPKSRLRVVLLISTLACTSVPIDTDAALGALDRPIPIVESDAVMEGSQAPAAQAPLGVPDFYATFADAALSISAATGILVNDFDPDGGTLTAVSINQTGMQGSVTVFSDGRFNYTPPSGFTGTDSFTYVMRNDSNLSSANTTVQILVQPIVDQPPVGLADSYSTAAGTPLAIAAPGVLANDIDPEGGPVTVISISQSGLQGSVTMFADGRFNYTPPAGFTGPDTFTYRMRDDAQQTPPAVSVVIHVIAPTVHAPVAVSDVYYTPSDITMSVSAINGLLANDIDFDDTNLTAVGSPRPANASVQLASDGSFVLTPAARFVGTTNFLYRTSDGTSTSPSAQVTVFIGMLGNIPTGVFTPPSASRLRLESIAPNPFNPATQIRFELDSAQELRARIYDLRGRVVATIVDEQLSAGRHALEWNGQDDAGARVASGTYVVELRTDSERTAIKIQLVK